MIVVKSVIRIRSFVIVFCVLALGPWGVVATVPVAAQGLDYRDPSKAPPSWGQFAKLVQYRFETWMGADEEVANRFRSHMVEHAGKEGGPPPSLVGRARLYP